MTLLENAWLVEFDGDLCLCFQKLLILPSWLHDSGNLSKFLNLTHVMINP